MTLLKNNYNHQYWIKHRKRLLLKKLKRYHSDLDYRIKTKIKLTIDLFLSKYKEANYGGNQS